MKESRRNSERIVDDDRTHLQRRGEGEPEWLDQGGHGDEGIVEVLQEMQEDRGGDRN